MAITNCVKNLVPVTSDTFVAKAQALTPELIHRTVLPRSLVRFEKQDGHVRVVPAPGLEDLPTTALRRGSDVGLDFGEHLVGYLTFTVKSTGTIPDAPVLLRFRFGEAPVDAYQGRDDFTGTLSESWVQEEVMYVDVLPATVRIPRRYAFRYIRISVIDTSFTFDVALSDISVDSVTSADTSVVPPLPASVPADIAKIDAVSIATMRDCMQLVFEDGPKRDRRLWIGDFRVEALVNYVTFRNFDLAKRCLYLFAGLGLNRGQVAACLYTEPAPIVGTVALYDYSLLFAPCLLEYFEASGDRDTAVELFPTVMTQIDLSEERLGADGVVRDSEDWWCFLDWHSELNKQAGAQGAFIYCARCALRLAQMLGKNAEADRLTALIDRLCAAAMAHLWDAKAGMFASGADRQFSVASQAWCALADILPPEENRALLSRVLSDPPEIGMVTPYMYHYFADALIHVGLKEDALALIRSYWGSMIANGADTFYEIWDPKDPDNSPYGSTVLNSYCHAFSGTPSYLIRKYFI